MALAQNTIIIIAVSVLIAALLLSIVFVVCFCYIGKKRGSKDSKKSRATHHYIPPRADNSGPNNVQLNKLPNARQTKQMEEGKAFVGIDGTMNRADPKHATKGASENNDRNYIMGPAADLSEHGDNGKAVDNAAFVADNQMESGNYIRESIDPADVAEAYMKDEYYKEASRGRRKQQLEVRRQVTKNKSHHARKSSKRSESGHSDVERRKSGQRLSRTEDNPRKSRNSKI